MFCGMLVRTAVLQEGFTFSRLERSNPHTARYKTLTTLYRTKIAKIERHTALTFLSEGDITHYLWNTFFPSGLRSSSFGSITNPSPQKLRIPRDHRRVVHRVQTGLLVTKPVQAHRCDRRSALHDWRARWARIRLTGRLIPGRQYASLGKRLGSSRQKFALIAPPEACIHRMHC